MKTTIIFLLLVSFATLSFPMSLMDAWSTSLSITNDIMDNDFWTKEMRIKCIEYKPFYKPSNDTYYVHMKFQITNQMSKHNLTRLKIRVLDYSGSVSCLVTEPTPAEVDNCAMDGDYLCFYYNDRITIYPSDTITFDIVAVINDTDFDVVHSKICFHAMQRLWLRATPVEFDVRFNKAKILPPNTIIDKSDYNEYDAGK